ncbi:uncharacterized protein LOC106804341 [Setaria italica]|uniref:uncharacterized protein LOC106804341 n=1 Tax=Setaria italica TaxID=4555 RepID=UPI0007199F0E|nr:uncharacterized protein LOC106804341 [Setaria italica]
MDFNFKRLQPCEEPFYSIVLDKGCYPIGQVVLPFSFGTQANYRTEYLIFEVANLKTSYHAILGRPMLVRFMAIPHHTYLILKMPAPNSVLSVYDDVKTSYKCDTVALQLAEVLEYSAKATAIVAEAQKLDKDQLTIPEMEPTPTTMQPNPKVKKICLSLEDPSKTTLIGSDLSKK